MFYIELILLGISLSIDAFSLALGIGLNIPNNKHKKYEIVVAAYHFIMPILGYLIRSIINAIIYIPNTPLLIGILAFIMIGIIIDKDSNKNVINSLLFGFSVSIDSFSIGLTLNREAVLIGPIIFSTFSYIFTHFGFKLSTYIKRSFNNKTKVISIAILLVILIYNILK